jgi:hypothetical protein
MFATYSLITTCYLFFPCLGKLKEHGKKIGLIPPMLWEREGGREEKG